jgi:hypothetical protein
MKRLMKLCLISAILALPAQTYAQNDASPSLPHSASMNCPMAAQAVEMQKTMNSMMSDMSAMMKGMRDPQMKERMGKMRDQMAANMVHMQEMHGTMGGAMMPGGQNPNDAAATGSSAPPQNPAEHDAHHPAR